MLLTSYIIRRIGQMLIILFGITIVSFTIMQLAPGDPVDIMAGRTATPEDKARIAAVYGFDQPIHVQYWRWLTRMLHGDFGTSFVTGQPVMKMILDRLPNTLYLNFVAMIVIYLFAIPIGVISALKQYSLFDHIVTTIAFLGRALPSFWFALLLIYYVGLKVDFIEFNGMKTWGIEFGKSPFWVVIVDRIKYLILPLTVLSFGGMAGITRYMRASMLEVIRQDYVRTARAKGLPERVVIFKHALRNALLPIITLLGFELPILFSGSVIIETIFSWPGIGLLSLRAVFQRDYAVVMAFNTIGATMTVLGTFLADILYVVVDPRIKY